MGFFNEHGQWVGPVPPSDRGVDWISSAHQSRTFRYVRKFDRWISMTELPMLGHIYAGKGDGEVFRWWGAWSSTQSTAPVHGAQQPKTNLFLLRACLSGDAGTAPSADGTEHIEFAASAAWDDGAVLPLSTAHNLDAQDANSYAWGAVILRELVDGDDLGTKTPGPVARYRSAGATVVGPQTNLSAWFALAVEPLEGPETTKPGGMSCVASVAEPPEECRHLPWMNLGRGMWMRWHEGRGRWEAHNRFDMPAHLDYTFNAGHSLSVGFTFGGLDLLGPGRMLRIFGPARMGRYSLIVRHFDGDDMTTHDPNLTLAVHWHNLQSPAAVLSTLRQHNTANSWAIYEGPDGGDSKGAGGRDWNLPCIMPVMNTTNGDPLVGKIRARISVPLAHYHDATFDPGPLPYTDPS